MHRVKGVPTREPTKEELVRVSVVEHALSEVETAMASLKEARDLLMAHGTGSAYAGVEDALNCTRAAKVKVSTMIVGLKERIYRGR